MTKLPTRVIDVGNEQNGWKLSLLEPKPDTAPAPYICLSHCWGSIPPLMTTTENIQERMEVIDFETLPANFIAAIRVAWNIGIQYVWIDSLCIIQNDSADWEREAANMGNIYEQAYLVVESMRSSNPTETPFYEPYDDLFGPFKITAVDPKAGQVTLHVRKNLHDNPVPTVLAARGWTFQEHLLAARVVQLDFYEFVWRCETITMCCCSAHSKKVENRKARFKEEISYTGPPLPGEHQLTHAWTEVVKDYSKRLLTKDSDRLPALSGIAKRFQRVFGTEYVAGLWSEDMINGLCWNVESVHKARRPSEYRAPSWSWASVEGEVRFSRPVHIGSVDGVGGYAIQPRTVNTWFPHEQFSLKILKIDCARSTIDPTGHVSGARLYVSGRIVQVEYRYDRTATHGGRYVCEKDSIQEGFLADVPLELQNADFVAEGEPLYVLILGWVNWGNTMSYRALVLRYSISTPSAYSRIGILRSSPQTPSQNVPWFGDDIGMTEVMII
jgi:hypothetical protein